MQRLATMVGFLSTNIEKAYFDDPKLGPRLVEAFDGDDYALELRDVIQAKHGFDLFEELVDQTRVTDVIVGRKTQAAAYQLIARHLISHLPIKVGFGYSVGQAVLARAAGAIGNASYEDDWAPLYAQMFARNYSAFESNTMKCAVLYAPDNASFAERVKARIAEDYPGRVFIRDYRPPSSLTIGGESSAIDELFADLAEQEAGLSEFSLAPFRADASHTDWMDHSQTLSVFLEQKSARPAIPICGSDGRIYAPQGHSDAAFARLLATSALGATQMAAVYDAIKDQSDGIVFVGSERVARFTFYGMEMGETPVFLINSRTLDLELGEPMRIGRDPAEGLALWRN